MYINIYISSILTLLYILTPVSLSTVFLLFVKINRIYHRSPMQTEKSQTSDQRMIPETRYRVKI